jgi:hypothetical protein
MNELPESCAIAGKNTEHCRSMSQQFRSGDHQPFQINNNTSTLVQVQKTILQRGLAQHSFYYTRENKCEKSFAESDKFHYTRSRKPALAAYEKCHYCLIS